MGLEKHGEVVAAREMEVAGGSTEKCGACDRISCGTRGDWHSSGSSHGPSSPFGRGVGVLSAAWGYAFCAVLLPSFLVARLMRDGADQTSVAGAYGTTCLPQSATTSSGCSHLAELARSSLAS
jgi:hypothetical protein